MRRQWGLVGAFLLLVVGWPPAEAASPVIKPRVLMNGVKVYQYQTPLIAQPNVVKVAEVANTAPVDWKVVSLGHRATVADLCRASHCIAGVNAGFFNPDGRPLSGQNPLVRQILGRDIPGIGPGAAVLMYKGIGKKWQPDGTFTNVRHPRTIVCDKPSSRLLITVDGRQPGSRGLDLNEATALVKSLGCKSAVNFDGGGSTTLATQGGRVENRPVGFLVRRRGQVLVSDGTKPGDVVMKPYLPVPVANAYVAVPKPKPAVKVLAKVEQPSAPSAITGGRIVQLALPSEPRIVVRPTSSRSKLLSVWAIALVIASTLLQLIQQRRRRYFHRPGKHLPAGLAFA